MEAGERFEDAMTFGWLPYDRDALRCEITRLLPLNEGAGERTLLFVESAFTMTEPRERAVLKSAFCGRSWAPLWSFACDVSWLRSVEYSRDRSVVVRALKSGLHVLLLALDGYCCRVVFEPDTLTECFGDDLVPLLNEFVDVMIACAPLSFDRQSITASGRAPTFLNEGSIVFEKLREYFELRSSADPRLYGDRSWVCQGVTISKVTLFVREALEALGFIAPSRSTIYNALAPRRSDSYEAQRHSPFHLHLRPRMPSRDGRNTWHPDAHFTLATNGKLMQLGYLLSGNALMLSKDDKKKMATTGMPVARPRRSWHVVDENGGVDAALDAPVHGWAQSSMTLTPSSTLVLHLDTKANTSRQMGTSPSLRGGSGFVHWKVSMVTPSTAAHQADLTVDVLLRVCVDRPLPPMLNIFVDGGSDQTMASPVNRLIYTLMLIVLDLDTLVVAKYHPMGGSKFNPTERLNQAIGLAIGGDTLIDETTLVQNFGVSGESAAHVDDVTATRIATLGLANAHARMSNSGATFSGEDIVSVPWHTDDKLHHLPDEWRAIDAGLRAAGGGRLPPALASMSVPISSDFEKLRQRLGLRPFGRHAVPLAEIVALAEDDDHAYHTPHTFIIGRCGDATHSCGKCSGAYRARDEAVKEILGKTGRVKAIRALVLPIIDAGNDGNHYESLTTAMLRRDERMRAPPPDMTPSSLIKDWIDARVITSRFTASVTEIDALAVRCCITASNCEMPRFRVHVEQALLKASAGAASAQAPK